MNKCTKCEKLTANPKFCSVSCSAKHNNSFRKNATTYGCRTRTCPSCGKYSGDKRRYCSECVENNRCGIITNWDKVTKADLKGRSYRYGNFHRAIRDAAYAVVKDRPKVCVVCGYDRRVDLCHIIPISKFSEISSISSINDPKNLVYLCKNHHDELDHGELLLTDS